MVSWADNDFYLAFSGAYVANRSLFFSNNRYNGLIKMDLDKECYEYLSVFPDEKLNAIFLHEGVCACDERLFFYPNLSRYVHIVDLNRGCVDRVECNADGKYSVLMGGVVKSFLWLVPKNLGQGIKYICLKNNDLHSPQWLNIPANDDSRTTFAAFDSNYLYIIVNDSPYMFVIDLIKEKIDKFYLGISDISRGILDKKLKCLWFVSTNKGFLYQYNLYSQSLQEIEIPNCLQGSFFSQIVVLSEGVWLIPKFDDYFLFYSIANCSWMKKDLPNEVCHHIVGREKLVFSAWCINIKDSVLLCPNSSKQMLMISENEIKYRNLYFQSNIVQEINKKHFSEMLKNNKVVQENEKCSLSIFLEVIK